VPGEPGDLEYGDAECCRVGWNWPAACIATVVAPPCACDAFVTTLRFCEVVFEVLDVLVVEAAAVWV
jgi:hypothetical protein